MQLYEHTLYRFELIEDGEVLLFTWKASTERMSDEDFREALHNYAGFGSEYQVASMLVDIRGFKYPMTPELAIWRDRDISPRYEKSGMKRLAYLVPPGLAEKMRGSASSSINPFEEGYFEDLGEVVRWLSA